MEAAAEVTAAVRRGIAAVTLVEEEKGAENTASIADAAERIAAVKTLMIAAVKTLTTAAVKTLTNAAVTQDSAVLEASVASEEAVALVEAVAG